MLKIFIAQLHNANDITVAFIGLKIRCDYERGNQNASTFNQKDVIESLS